MKPAKGRVGPPKGVSAGAAAFWRSIASAYALNEEGIELLRLATLARDRADAARAILKREGLVAHTKAGVPFTHPASRVLKESEDTVLRCLRQMGLE